MRQFHHTIQAMRIAVMLVLAVLMLATPFSGLAQDAAPADPAPAPGGLQVSLAGLTGAAISGVFAVTDSVGVYQEFAVNGGFGSASNLAAGPATVAQVSGTTDFALDSVAQYVEIPAGGISYATFFNAYLDADGDGIGDSVDTCPAGNDLVDSDWDGLADACDETPNGDPTPVPTLEPTTAPTTEPATAPETPVAAPTITGTPEGTPAPEEAALTVEVADVPVIVEDAPVSCQDAAALSPWIASDLADYAPGSLVTLTSGGWAPGQTVEILVEDDGVADAVQGEWSHSATEVADDNGALTYTFNIAPWYVADYTVVATGECAKAETAFTDSVQGGSCVQVTTSDVVAPGSYIMFRCASAANPIRIGVASISTGWQWAYVFNNDQNLTPPAYSSLNWNTTGTASDSSASGSINTAYFFLSPTSSVLPGGTGSASIQIKNPNGTSIQYTSNITAHRAIQASDFTMSCTPASQTIGVTSSGTLSCTLSAISIASGASVSASIPTPTAPAGWSLTAATALSGTVTQSTPLVVRFTLAPTCSAATTAQAISVTSSLVLSNANLVQAPAVAGPSASGSVARSSTSTFATRVTSATLDWSRAYSFTASPSNAGSLSYALDAVGCSGWNVQVSASPFVSAEGRTIPASNLTLTGTTAPSGTGLTRPSTTGALNTSTTVLSASPTNGIGSYAQTLSMNMNIPAGSLVGTYQSTITITASSGP